ncbi:MAG: MFS transporter [Promethearchaeota archaeon]
MLEKEKEKEKNMDLETFKKLTKDERKRIRESRRIDSGFPTKMNKYLYFVLIFAGIVTFFDGWCTIAITLAMSSFSGTTIDNILKPLIDPDLFSYFGLSASPLIMGVVLSFAGTGVIAAISFKYLVDKYGRRPMTLITAIGFTTFTVLTAFSPRGPGGLIYFLIFRIFSNYFLSADIVTIIIAEEAPDHLRGRLVGVVLATNAIGGVVCAIIQMLGIRVIIEGPLRLDLTTWQSLFFFTIFGYVLIIPLFFFLKETKRFTAMKQYEDWRKKKGLKPKTGWFVPLQKQYSRGMILGCIGGFCSNLIYFAQVTFFGIYFRQELNMSPELIGLVALPVAGAGGIGFLLAGPLLDRWGRIACVRRFAYLTFIGGLMFSCPSVFVEGNVANPIIISIVVAGGALGAFSLILSMAALTILPIEMMPTHIRSTAMGWIGSISRGAMILAPFFMMFGAEKVGGLGLSYQFMFATMGMQLTVILYAIYMLAPESKGRGLEELIGSEIYTKQKKIRDKKYKEPYYLFMMELGAFFGMGFLYGQTTGANYLQIFTMVGLYGIIAFICFMLVVYVREKVM